MFYTYKITCMVTLKIYFGYTSQTIQQRFTKHIHEKRNTHIKNSLKKYGKENHTIELVAEHHDANTAKRHEQMLISTYQTNTRRYPEGNGLNLTDGGEGALGYTFSEEQKQYMKENKMAWYAESHNKPVYQFDGDGTLVAQHNSAKTAGEYVGAYSADISKCCRGIIRTVCGYFFSYTTTPHIREKTRGSSPLKKQVSVIGSDGTQCICESVSAACKKIACNRTSLLQAIKTQKPVKGFSVSLI